MRLILKLAFRNLWRNKRRTILTLLAVFIPVLLLDVTWGFVGAWERALFDNTVRLETGHIQIHAANYRKVGQALPFMDDVRPVLDALQKDPAIEWYTVRLDLPALAAAGSRSQGVLLQGVEPQHSQQISLMSQWVHEGRYLSDGDRGVAVAGSGLLKKLMLKTGDQLILLVSHPETGTGVLLPRVAGILDAPSRDLTRSIVQVTLEDARSVVRMEDAATAVIALVHGVRGPWDAPTIRHVAAQLQQQLGNRFTVETWEEVAPEAVGLLQILRPMTIIFMVIFFVLAGLVVLNTLYLNILERTHELGVILAIGSGRRRMLVMITIEALVIAGIGAMLGSLLGIGLVAYWSHGLVMPGLYQEIYAQLSLQPVLYLSITPWEAALSFAAMLMVGLLAAWLPARRAARLEPVEAMRAT
jgi:ABC-type lipoprotein release transport system permease subunit